jgi:hypothetical protein
MASSFVSAFAAGAALAIATRLPSPPLAVPPVVALPLAAPPLAVSQGWLTSVVPQGIPDVVGNLPHRALRHAIRLPLNLSLPRPLLLSGAARAASSALQRPAGWRGAANALQPPSPRAPLPPLSPER